MIILKNIYKKYVMGSTEINALNGINFEIEKSEFLVIMGESGSGKSTLLHVIGGIDNVTSGKVLIDNKNLSGMKDQELTLFRRINIGFVFQNFNLLPGLTVEENINLPLLISGKNKNHNNNVEKLLEITGLEDRRSHKPAELSGGQQQRVAIARAFVMNPKIILLDEPTGNLDSKTGMKILELIKITHREFGTTIILVTHSPFVAENADRIIFLKDGAIKNSLIKKNNNNFSSMSIYTAISHI